VPADALAQQVFVGKCQERIPISLHLSVPKSEITPPEEVLTPNTLNCAGKWRNRSWLRGASREG